MPNGSAIFVPEHGCLACKVARMEVPKGDLGAIFLSGFCTGKEMSHEQRENVRAALCVSHASTLRVFEAAHTGLFPGLVKM